MVRPEYSGINLTMKKRTVVLFVIIFTLILILVLRVGWIQLLDGPELQKLAVEQWTNEVKIDAKRGKILDRNGSELAVSVTCERVDAYMLEITKAEKENKNIKKDIAEKLSAILGEKQEYILGRLNKTLSNGKPLNSVTIKRRIQKSQADEIRKLKLPGIVISEDSKRYYPDGNFLSQVLGFTNIDGAGQEGLEKKYNDVLKGMPGRRIMETDPSRRELSYNISGYIEPVNGNDLVLTIDESIQMYVEKAIEDAMLETKAKAVTAIVMDPKTGEILAMANTPGYDPNNPRDMMGYTNFNDVMKLWNNRAVTFTYEPGSIFKVVTAVAALSEGLVSDNDTFTCTGSKKVADRILHCWRRKGHGTQNFSQILQNSCNVGFMVLGERLQKEKLYKYIDAFGFGKPTGIDLSFEESGQKRPISKVGPVELANLSFGQGISVTPIQMLTAFSAIANDGKMVQPHIVKRIQSTDKNGNVTVLQETKTTVIRQVMDEETSKKMRDYLEKVVSIGGGKKAFVQGYHIGGKTGTAQKAEGGAYAGGKYVASFLGMAPVEDPQFALFLCIDEPDPSNYYAGQIAAPVAGRIFKDIFTCKNIQPDGSDEPNIEIIIPNVTELTKNEAVNKLKSVGLQVEVKGTGKVIASMNPKPGLSVKTGSKVILYTGNAQNYNNKVIVPNLYGMDAGEAYEVLNSLGLKMDAREDGYIVEQDPEVGEEVTKGSRIKVEYDVYD